VIGREYESRREKRKRVDEEQKDLQAG